MKEIYDNLSMSLKFDSTSGNLKVTKSAFSQLATSFTELEKCKVRTIVRLATEKLDEHKNNKVLLYFNRKKCIDAAARALKEFNPMIFDGDTPQEKRVEYNKRFQEHNNKWRLIISNPTVGGVGLSFDDTSSAGSFPRTQFISPDYNLIRLTQTAGRIYRTNTKSTASTYLVFCEELPEEQNLIDKLGMKSDTAKSYALENNTTLPGEYEFYYEPKKKIYDDNFDIVFD
jgi:hypothetical protein